MIAPQPPSPSASMAPRAHSIRWDAVRIAARDWTQIAWEGSDSDAVFAFFNMPMLETNLPMEQINYQ